MANQEYSVGEVSDSLTPSQWGGYGLCILIYAWIMANVPVLAIPFASHDDDLFIRGALNLLAGHWLGPYDNLTLAKGPFYPIWIAVNWIVGLPILVSQGLFYAASCMVLVRALRNWIGSEIAIFCLFIFLLFSPMPFGVGQLRVMREGIYGPMTILIVALGFWWAHWRNYNIKLRALFAIGYGALFSAYWVTREEGMWIVPTLLVIVGIYACNVLRAERNCGSFAREGGLLALAAGMAVAGVTGVSLMNLHYYGVADVVEFKQPQFINAYAALARIKHKEETPYVVVPREAINRASAVSPAAQELQPYFLHPGFVEVGCTTYNVVPCDGEVRAGWFMWALRAAVASAGHYTSAVDARQFYGRLAQEINDACVSGRLECLPPHYSLAPPFRWDYVRPTIKTAGAMLRSAATDFLVLRPPEVPFSCIIDDCGSERMNALFFDTIHTSLFMGVEGLKTRRLSADEKPLRSQLRTALVARVLNVMTIVYRTILPIAGVVAVISFLLAIILLIVRKRWEPMLIVATISAVVLLSRVALLSYLDVVAIPSNNSLYLSPAFPFLLLFCFAAPTAALRLLPRNFSGGGPPVSRLGGE
ncbi:MAG: hypothetical protein P4L50_14515 [Anaerolineaceae bacterium]|nr:hypothetical protein [Anaerolineaceae bacterium]